ncbi:hypothetical protein BJY52DRAFT_851764 [Lactarius psammicola]|nr:hypothetical protein BJY52DRAFT_851764 [Lactarius psammicola]
MTQVECTGVVLEETFFTSAAQSALGPVHFRVGCVIGFFQEITPILPISFTTSSLTPPLSFSPNPSLYMSEPISTTNSGTANSPSTTKWMVAVSGVFFLFALGTFLYLAHRRGAQRVPSIEENNIRPSHPRPHLATKIAFPVSGVARGPLYVHRGVPSPSTSAALSSGTMPPVRRDKVPGGSVLSPGSRLALV